MAEATATTPAEAGQFSLPRVTIQFCTQCKWMLRAAYVSSARSPNPRCGADALQGSNVYIPVLYSTVVYCALLYGLRGYGAAVGMLNNAKVMVTRADQRPMRYSLLLVQSEQTGGRLETKLTSVAVRPGAPLNILDLVGRGGPAARDGRGLRRPDRAREPGFDFGSHDPVPHALGPQGRRRFPRDQGAQAPGAGRH